MPWRLPQQYTASQRYNRNLRASRQRQYLRISAIQKLGGCCLHCGNKDMRVLEIDHIKGDADLECTRKESSGQQERKRIRYILNTPIRELTGRYQILCSNCHRIKTYENQDYLASEPGSAKQQSLFQQY